MLHPTPLRSWSWLLAVLATITLAAAEEPPLRFGRDVLPILSDRCFHCHGPDEANREAGLRLDMREAATEDLGGYAAIVPGDPDASEIIQRIEADDESLVMPPADSHRKPLEKHEREILRKWIASGAKWGKHWAFEPPVRPPTGDTDEHPIDVLVRRRLQQLGLAPSPRAEPHTLARRVSFDLTGLPPTPEQVASVVADDASAAYTQLVDELLASPRYGERMAMWWLDAARYSDTDGFQQDAVRTNWPWRDWVVNSFNANKPFDQFTIEQLAGDLLPNATEEQKLATCFHRNHPTNGEGGRHPEESRVDYVIDRVNTTGTVWLGLTLGCCQCHSHKFDPISQQEYYQLTAFFNSINETGEAGGKARPYLKLHSPYAGDVVAKAEELAKRRAAIEHAVREQAEPHFERWLEDQLIAVQSGFEPWTLLEAVELDSDGGAKLTQADDMSIVASGRNPDQDNYRVVVRSPLRSVTGVRLEVLPDPAGSKNWVGRGKSGEFVVTTFKMQVGRDGQVQFRDTEFATAMADSEAPLPKGKSGSRTYGRVADLLFDDPRNGWTVPKKQLDQPHTAVVRLAAPIQLADDEHLVILISHGSDRYGANLGRFRLSVTDLPAQFISVDKPAPLEQLAELNAASTAEVPEALRNELRQQFLATYEPYQQAMRAADAARKQHKQYQSQAGELRVMVMRELKKPRDTFVLERGVWDQHGEKVQAGVPAAVLEWPAEQTKSRLDLANWIVARENPLTARVVANQLWQTCFGTGLVRTPEDFGLQGEVPMHPELLDWLAVELVESGWDVKHVLKLIVTSDTYQQSSKFTPELLEKDPENKLLARGARFRLPSWMIRDAALASSGLLDDTFGGPPMMPYQPRGVWEALFKGRFVYEPSQGDIQFRRTLYAFWRRSSTPTYLFDVAPRRTCEVRPRRTNTPLHALTLMNDLSQLEAARALAVQIVSQQGSLDQRIQWLFARVLSREATDAELAALRPQLEAWLAEYEKSPQDARALLDFGQPERKVDEQFPETAAYTVLASLVLNLDEAITHE
ncbi:PSD1 and planctomycete cytochrome C domain-containing protein [Aeoliella sp.]|uniref:PSD1 and planctomycete cytochrome C domain-containing protein n=1 Tax=Aeoliella sp. TaxID=2795800 RepID=UPI003CCBFFDD